MTFRNSPPITFRGAGSSRPGTCSRNPGFFEKPGFYSSRGSENPERLEPPEQYVPRLEPRNKDINLDRVKYKSILIYGRGGQQSSRRM